MNAASVERLLLKAGQQPTALDLRALDAAIDSQRLRGGRNVRTSVYPWGTSVHYDGGGGGGSLAPYFKPAVSNAREGLQVSWSRGLIGGVEPTISGIPISGDKKKGERPKFTIDKKNFNDRGECFVYFKASLTPDWSISKVEPFASSKVPPTEPWTAFKLALILFSGGQYWRALVTNQGHLAISRQSTGFAIHLFWADF